MQRGRIWQKIKQILIEDGWQIRFWKKPHILAGLTDWSDKVIYLNPYAQYRIEETLLHEGLHILLPYAEEEVIEAFGRAIYEQMTQQEIGELLGHIEALKIRR